MFNEIGNLKGEKIGGKPELTWMDGIQSIKVG